jgi:hypothetical protein
MDSHLLWAGRRRLAHRHTDRGLIALDRTRPESAERGPGADALLFGVLAEVQSKNVAHLHIFVNVWHLLLGTMITQVVVGFCRQITASQTPTQKRRCISKRDAGMSLLVPLEARGTMVLPHNGLCRLHKVSLDRARGNLTPALEREARRRRTRPGQA